MLGLPARGGDRDCRSDGARGAGGADRRLPLMPAAALVAVFALFHGYAHGREFDGADALLFSLAFVASTGLLHLLGILLGEFGGGRLGIGSSGADWRNCRRWVLVLLQV